MVYNKNLKSIIIFVWNYKGVILISLNKIIKYILNFFFKVLLFFLYGKFFMNLFMDIFCDVRLLYLIVIIFFFILLGLLFWIFLRLELCVEIFFWSFNDKLLFDEMLSVLFCLNFRFLVFLYKIKYIVLICLFYVWIL